MKFYFWAAIIVAMIIFYPFIRWFAKRFILLFKITVLCKKKKYKLYKNYIFWYLRKNHSENCDFFIETKNNVYAIKLFGIKKRLSIMVFLDDNKYFIRNHIFYGLPFTSFVKDSKIQEFPEYNFFFNYKGIWNLKKHHSVLLINPCCYDFKYKFKTNCYSGDRIGEMEIHSLAGLIKTIKTYRSN